MANGLLISLIHDYFVLRYYVFISVLRVMLVVEGVIYNACCFFLFQYTQKIRCLILHYRDGSFRCGGSTCYSENFLFS